MSSSTESTGFTFGATATTTRVGGNQPTGLSGFQAGAMATKGPVTFGVQATGTQQNVGGGLGITPTINQGAAAPIGVVPSLTTAVQPSDAGLGANSGLNASLLARTTAGTTTTAPQGLLGLLAAKPNTSLATALSSAGTTANTATGIFAPASSASSSASTMTRGLGGDDPKTSRGHGSSGVAGKLGDGKAVKETQVPNEICATVENFKRYVKMQKTVRENITRMSSRPMFKVQEEVASLKQFLSLVSNGLQHNAIAIEKLKAESAAELKHAEVAQRTKDTPPGLQYENTAPSEYFQRLVESFEGQMIVYRQQIEEMESHLASLNEGTILTPQELSLLLAKLHESFLALAAQLQVIHDAIQLQKDHYLNFRRIFHGATVNVFEKKRKVESKPGRHVQLGTTTGPDPFEGISNAAAVAMASAMNRTQDPNSSALGASAGGLMTGTPQGATRLTTGPMGGGLFNTGASAATAFGPLAKSSVPQTAVAGTSSMTSLGGLGSNTATVRPLGSTFGSTAAAAPNLTGVASPFSQSQPASAFGAAGGLGGSTALNDSAFQLQKPPTGNKRGKKA